MAHNVRTCATYCRRVATEQAATKIGPRKQKVQCSRTRLRVDYISSWGRHCSRSFVRAEQIGAVVHGRKGGEHISLLLQSEWWYGIAPMRVTCCSFMQ